MTRMSNPSNADLIMHARACMRMHASPRSQAAMYSGFVQGTQSALWGLWQRGGGPHKVLEDFVKTARACGWSWLQFDWHGRYRSALKTGTSLVPCIYCPADTMRCIANLKKFVVSSGIPVGAHSGREVVQS